MKNQNKYLLRKRAKVLKLAKNIIVKKGLTSQTLKITAKEFGLDLDEIELLFPNGKNDLVQFTLDQLNNELEEFCKKIDLIRLPIHKRVKKILLLKIYLMNKEKIFYKKIFINLLVPKKNISPLSQLYKSIDHIWFLAGDVSVDFNFYTKRIILAGIYSRVILFFFNNNNQKDLEKIIDQDLRRVSKIPELKLKLNMLKGYFPKILKFVKNSY